MSSVKSGLKTAKMHLSQGFNGMLPLIIVGAVGLSMSAIFPSDGVLGELFSFLNEVGLSKFDIFVALLIGQSMSQKSGMAAGFILGMYSNQLGLGIFGGIVVGFIAGYAGMLFNKLKISGSNKALLSLVVVPLVTSIVGFFLLKYVISGPIIWLQASLITLLNGISSTSAVLLAIVLGLMVGFDLGGPINKTAGMFVLIAATEGVRGPLTYAIAAYMLPSMAAGLASIIGKKTELFDEEEKVAGPSIFLLGLLSLSEPALPMMFADMKFMVPANMICSAILCAGYALFNIESTLALGFLSFFFMNNVIIGLAVFVISLALLTTLILYRRKSLLSKGLL